MQLRSCQSNLSRGVGGEEEGGVTSVVLSSSDVNAAAAGTNFAKNGETVNKTTPPLSHLTEGGRGEGSVRTCMLKKFGTREAQEAFS